MKYTILLLSVSCFLLSCNGGAAKQAEIQAAKQHIIDSVNAAHARLRTIDSMRTVEARRAEINAQNDAANSTTAPEKKKKGWSGAAKGAVIGAGTGAVAGAVIDKKHGEGAVVGGLIGAGVGAATGAVIDSKNKKKKKKTTATH